jgi:hypothetical protein
MLVVVAEMTQAGTQRVLFSLGPSDHLAQNPERGVLNFLPESPTIHFLLFLFFNTTCPIHFQKTRWFPA